jgi:hypothetical protein
VTGKTKPAIKEEVRTVPTLQAFATRFLEGYARANRLKPSGFAAKESILRQTVNNVLTTLNVLLKTAVEWGVRGTGTSDPELAGHQGTAGPKAHNH